MGDFFLQFFLSSSWPRRQTAEGEASNSTQMSAQTTAKCEGELNVIFSKVKAKGKRVKESFCFADGQG